VNNAGIVVGGPLLHLLIQFNNAVKPLLVFAAAPYGAIGALIALAIMGTPFGFMVFLGVASLIGVIVSHVVVLFDFIEEMHDKGEPLERALPDAGIERIRPVMITVAATILALFPLALEGGPLWKPLCYAQIGGLAVSTFITLLWVPVFYSLILGTPQKRGLQESLAKSFGNMGKAEERGGENLKFSIAERRRHFRQATLWFEKMQGVYDRLRARGPLSHYAAKDLASCQEWIETCNAKLANLGSNKSAILSAPRAKPAER
jgi:predicted RND superfamily exporter protein